MSEDRTMGLWAAYERRMETYTVFGLRRTLDEAAFRFVANALFPRLCARLLHWPSRLRPRAAVVYVLGSVLLAITVVGPVQVFARRQLEELGKLTEELGHEPTPEEIAEHFGWDPPTCRT